MADAIPASGTGRPVAVGSPSLSIVVEGIGDSLGAVVGEITIPAGTGDTQSTAPQSVTQEWTENEADYSVTSGPDSQLRFPEVNSTRQIGWWVLTRDGTAGDLIPRMAFDPGIDFTDREVEINSAGDAFALTFTNFDVGTPPHLTVKIAGGDQVPNDTTIFIHKRLPSPDTSITTEQLNHILAEQTRLQHEIDNIHQQPAGVTVPLPPNVTTAEARAGTETFARLWNARADREGIDARVDESRVAALTGGFVRDGSVSGSTLSLVHVRADGTSDTITFTPPTTPGGGGITVEQATDAAGALLSTLSQFAYNASSNTLTFTETPQTPPTDISLNQLSQTLQTLIGTLQNRAAVDSAIRQQVEEWARVGTGDRIPESRLPQKVDDFADALTLGGFKAVDDVDDIAIANRWSTVSNPTNASALTFVSSFQNTPAYTNVYGVVRLRNTVPLDNNHRFHITETDAPDLDDVTFDRLTFLDDEGDFNYYVTPLIPAVGVGANVGFDGFTPYHLDGRKLGIPDWVTSIDTPIPRSKLINAPVPSNTFDEAAATALINRLRPVAYTAGEKAKLAGLTAGGEPNPPLASNAEVDAGTETGRRGYSPSLVQRQIDHHQRVPDSTASNNGQVLKVRAGVPAWLSDTVIEGAWTVPPGSTEGIPVLTPVASADNAGNLLHVNGVYYANPTGTAWEEFAFAKDTLRRQDQAYPAKTATPQGQEGRVRLQGLNVTADTRDDQSMVFGPVVPHVITRNQVQQEFGVAVATTLPDGFIHGTYYPPNSAYTARRGQVWFTMRQAFLDQHWTDLKFRLSTEAQAAEDDLAYSDATVRRGSNDVVVARKVTLPASKRPTVQRGINALVNNFNASGNYSYITEGSQDIQYLPAVNLKPRIVGRATDAIWATIRTGVRDNEWDNPTVGTDPVIMRKGDLPPNRLFWIRLRCEGRSPDLWTRPHPTDELLSFPDVDWDRGLDGSDERERTELLDPTHALYNNASDRSCYRFTIAGQVVLWGGWRSDAFVLRTDHAGYWVNGSKFDVFCEGW